MASVSSACTTSGRFIGAATMATVAMTIGRARVSTAPLATSPAGRRWRNPWTASTTAATAAMISSSQTVPGTWPVCSTASVSAP